MKRPTHASSFGFPFLMARMMADSWETIWHRSMMMAQGTCSVGEYQRMVDEKATAMRRSMKALMTGQSQSAVVAPFANRARANAKRLRRKA